MPGIRALSPTDRLTLAYLGAIGLLTVVWHHEPAPLLLRLAALAALIVLAAEIRSTSPTARFVHDFLPILTMACIFNWTGPVIAATNRGPWDLALAGIDREFFGTLQARWFGMLGRPWWLTDAASLSYVSYYFVPVVMGLALYRADRRADFEALVFTVVGSLLVTYVCYFALPASGPRVAYADEARVLGGGTLSTAIRTALRFAEANTLDAFPSGHTAVSIVYLACGWRLLPRWRAPLVVVTAGIVFSTVYLSLHYVIDVVVGALLVPLLALLLPLLRPWALPAAAVRVPQRPSSSARQPRLSQPIRSNRPLR